MLAYPHFAADGAAGLSNTRYHAVFRTLLGLDFHQPTHQLSERPL